MSGPEDSLPSKVTASLPNLYRARSKAIPIAREGLPLIFRFLAIAFVLAFIPFELARVLAALFFVLAIFSAYFFRDPDRVAVQDASVVLAPGDGRILEVTEETVPELGGKAKVVRIFLSVFDIHVQRAPVSGKVAKIQYKKGKFLDARNPRACFENEQNAILIENEQCKVMVKQIAGFIARRIVCWVSPGQQLTLGQRLGLIRFGSQVDLYLTPDAEVCVSPGERLIGGVSLVAIHKPVKQSKPAGLAPDVLTA